MIINIIGKLWSLNNWGEDDDWIWIDDAAMEGESH